MVRLEIAGPEVASSARLSLAQFLLKHRESAKPEALGLLREVLQSHSPESDKEKARELLGKTEARQRDKRQLRNSRPEVYIKDTGMLRRRRISQALCE